MAARRSTFTRQRKSRGFTQEAFAHALGVDRTTVQRWERGEGEPQPVQRPKIAELLGVTADQLGLLLTGEAPEATGTGQWSSTSLPDSGDELEAMELVRRVEASDVGNETLCRLERVFEELATAYPTSPPQELLERVRTHTAYVGRLLDAPKTLREHRRLLVVGGWFSLFGATLHIDLDQPHAATARLRTAGSLARHADHAEIESWCYETEAWRVLTDGDYARALELSLRAQSVAPSGSSVAVQATAQEGRARARLGQTRETRTAVDRVQNMAVSVDMIRRPEHHYQYDPEKAVAYTATTLAWIGDRAAEGYAREIIARLSPGNDFRTWPRRVASASIDLALTLLAGDRLDEACDAAQKAILSGRVVPSNHWRALEVVKAVEHRQLPEAPDLREAFEGMKSPSSRKR
ncbi:helix-turn-helix domain-containing protein [Streptomyces sp. NPDC049881]|uniref:helix-turn-helix domain-containing protein n=1 Tax=Streptomyces sp. NPDC049881 TaxID=3155778 RepID=UPI003429A98A